MSSHPFDRWATLLWLVLGSGACGSGEEQDVRAIAVSAGREHTCALFEDGGLRCWGQTSKPPGGAPLIDLGGRTVAVSSGANWQCARLDDQRVKCWGVNNYGQLGRAGCECPPIEAQPWGHDMPYLDLGSGVRVEEMGVGGFAGCVITTDDRVKCWGRNIYGQLGLGDMIDRGAAPGTMGDALPFVDLGTSGAKPVKLGLGLDAACALFDTGKIKCWGANYNGTLGIGDFGNRGDAPNEMGDALPFVELGATAAVQVAVGGNACALLEGGIVKCWGANGFGAVGHGDTSNHPGPPAEPEIFAVDLGQGQRAVQVAVGLLHSCALLDGGKVKCWGQNAYGQLGLGDRRDRGGLPGEMGDALPTVNLGSGAVVQQLVAGDHHTCALLEGGHIKCWGRSNRKQTGYLYDGDIGIDPAQMGDALPPVKLW